MTPAALALFDLFDAGDTPRNLLSLASDYREILSATMTGTATDNDYRDALHRIEEASSPASAWLDTLDRRLSATLRTPQTQ